MIKLCGRTLLRSVYMCVYFFQLNKLFVGIGLFHPSSPPHLCCQYVKLCAVVVYIGYSLCGCGCSAAISSVKGSATHRAPHHTQSGWFCELVLYHTGGHLYILSSYHSYNTTKIPISIHKHSHTIVSDTHPCKH